MESRCSDCAGLGRTLRSSGQGVAAPLFERACRFGVGGAASKPRDLGSDRGYRVAAIDSMIGFFVWAGLNLNPHPLQTKRVRHPTAVVI